MPFHPPGAGWIEVISGSMFSGKTEELIRRLRRALIARQRVQAFRPRIDQRYSDCDIASHQGRTLQAELITTTGDIEALLRPDTQVVGVDEAQFLDAPLVALCERLALQGIRVVVAGLDQDFLGRPFGVLPELMAVAEYVTKTHAICVICGSPGTRSHRIHGDPQGERVVVGAAERYVPLCRLCHHRQREAADAWDAQQPLEFDDAGSDANDR